MQLSQQYHPDINKEPGAREKFQKVSEAWAVLKDTRQKLNSFLPLQETHSCELTYRREYDKLLRQEGVSSSAGTWYPSGSSYDHSTEWSSHSRRHTRQSAEWAWSYSYRTSAGALQRPVTRDNLITSHRSIGGSAFRRPHRTN